MSTALAYEAPAVLRVVRWQCFDARQLRQFRGGAACNALAVTSLVLVVPSQLLLVESVRRLGRLQPAAQTVVDERRVGVDQGQAQPAQQHRNDNQVWRTALSLNWIVQILQQTQAKYIFWAAYVNKQILLISCIIIFFFTIPLLSFEKSRYTNLFVLVSVCQWYL